MFFLQNGQTKNVPLILWLAGGPGSPLVGSLFLQNGPLEMVKLNGEIHMQMRNFTWNREYALLYIDNPIGTGFSFTDDERGYVTNQEEVGRDLYEALRQFFILFKEYHGVPFYLTGVSYAGKYVPAIGHKILSMGQQAKNDGFNLQGLAIGNGFVDPKTQSDYGDFLWKLSVIDKAQRDHFISEQNKFKKLIDQKEFFKAAIVMNELFTGVPITGRAHYPSYFYNVTGLSWYYNTAQESMSEDMGYFMPYIFKNSTREALHLGNRQLNTSAQVFNHLLLDIFKSTKHWVEELLNANYRMLFFNGNLDIIVAATLTENFLNGLQWNKANKFYAAERKVWKVSKEDHSVAGYVKRVDNLYFAVVRNAGHIVTHDQPRIAYDMISRFISGKDF